MRKIEFDEAKARELYDQGLGDQKIGDALGVGRTTIARWRVREGLAANLPPLKHGTRPEVIVEVPEGLLSTNERLAAARAAEEAKAAEEEKAATAEARPEEDATAEAGPEETVIKVRFPGCAVRLTAESFRKAVMGAAALMAIVRGLENLEDLEPEEVD